MAHPGGRGCRGFLRYVGGRGKGGEKQGGDVGGRVAIPREM